jgi:triphosphoribosyl-dephospho-CoA synthase
MRDVLREAIRAAYLAACRQEMEALKPGNVHLFADGHGMSASQFFASAEASAVALSDPGLPVGQRILDAVRATREAVGMNTNLGILLLCAPLACAAQLAHDGDPSKSHPSGARELGRNVDAILRSMTMDDAKAVFEAIVLASPGGLGTPGTHDVRNAPTGPLLQAMLEASGRDMIARQYVTAFQDVFETGLAAHDQALARGESGMWPTVFAYMAFLTAFPDSHVARKFGPGIAAAVQREAVAVHMSLDAIASERERIELLAAFDRSLKARGINPGTSADLTVACLLAHNFRGELA